MARPWGTNQLRKLGKAISAGERPPLCHELTSWHENLGEEVRARIEGYDWSGLLEDRTPSCTARAKTIATIQQKLQRDPHNPLQRIQDLAGVRFEADMTLDEQDKVTTIIAELFDHDAYDDRIRKDLRARPHSGYRAVHLWLIVDGGRVEVQVRTKVQGEWANVYEAAADVIGREIRYGLVPDEPTLRDVVEGLQRLSINGAADLERVQNEIGPRMKTLERTRARGVVFPPEIEEWIQMLRAGKETYLAGLKDLQRTIDRIRTMRASRGRA